MRSATAIAMVATVSLLLGTAWAQQRVSYDRLAAARQRLQVRSLRSAVVSFYRSLDNDELDAAKGHAEKIRKLWDTLDSDLQSAIDKAMPGTSQRAADLESECVEAPAPAAASQPASQPAPAAAKTNVKALPEATAPNSGAKAPAPATEIARMGKNPAAAISPDPKRSGAKAAEAGDLGAPEPWRPKYANEYDIFGDHPKGPCAKYKGAAEPAPQQPQQPTTPGAAPAAKTAPPRNDGGSIDQIIKTTPVQKTPKKKK
ncbi:MAG: hypothetical protein LLG01_05805 [Planctomycetaceae bacterium]|nr:hypothetical protein [Planctomycetaceae bacterium]